MPIDSAREGSRKDRSVTPWHHVRRHAGAFLVASLAVVAMASAVNAQRAQAGWWDGITGFGPPGYEEQEERPRRAHKEPELPNDLRPGHVAMRSDEMLRAIDDAIERHQYIVSKGGWPRVLPGRTLRPGDDDERIPPLRRRLAISGDLSRRAYDYYYGSYSYDQELEAAVRRFQERHGLRVSGRVDQPTFAALNVPAEARLNQLVLNRDRVRGLLAQRVEDRYVLVNIPAFQLEAVDRFDVQMRHRVIAGRTERQTPELKATIRGLNFFPYWRVPDSIAQLDIIPHMRKDPQYIQKERIRVYSTSTGAELDPASIDWFTADSGKLKFKQDPGPQNALGLVRIDMSNEHTVYMHDTPLKNLFTQRGRAFSAGCVRVQDVYQLAEWIARYEPGWDRPGRAEEVLAAGQSLDVQLSRPVPVYFTYITAWAEPSSGRVEFRPDLYGRDGGRELTAGLESDPSDPPPPPPSLAP